MVKSKGLSEHEQEIIACTFFNADLPLTVISQRTGIGVQSIRKILSRLRERGTMRVCAHVNPYAIGLQEFIALITVRSPGDDNRRRLIEAFVASPLTTYVAELGHDIHISVMFVVRNLSDMPAFFEAVSQRVPDIEFEKQLSPCLQLTRFSPKYLSRKRFDHAQLQYGPVETPAKLDELDLRVLSVLMQNDVSRKSEITRKLGIPATTLDYRLKSLKDRGVLLGIGYTIQLHHDGMNPFALTLVLRRPDPACEKSVAVLAEKHPSITYCLRSIGHWDFMLGVRLADARDISAVTQEFRKALDRYVSSIHVISVNRIQKLVPYPLGHLHGAIPSPSRAGG